MCRFLHSGLTGFTYKSINHSGGQLTPEDAEKIYYEAYQKAVKEASESFEPVDQLRVRMSAWQVVIDRINEDHVKSIAESYLNQCGS